MNGTIRMFSQIHLWALYLGHASEKEIAGSGAVGIRVGVTQLTELLAVCRNAFCPAARLHRVQLVSLDQSHGNI